MSTQWGVYLTKGHRWYMEDRHVAEYADMPDGECVGLFAIYDGHGGKKCVNYIQENLMDAVLRHPEFAEGDMSTALRTPPSNEPFFFCCTWCPTLGALHLMSCTSAVP